MFQWKKLSIILNYVSITFFIAFVACNSPTIDNRHVELDKPKDPVVQSSTQNQGASQNKPIQQDSTPSKADNDSKQIEDLWSTAGAKVPTPTNKPPTSPSAPSDGVIGQNQKTDVGAFLKLSDFTASLTDIPSAQLIETMNLLSDVASYYTPNESQSNTNQPKNECEQKLSDQKIGGDSSNLEISLDKLDCQILATTNKGKERYQISLTTKGKVTCAMDAFADLSKMNLLEVFDVNILSKCLNSKGSWFTNTRSNYVYTQSNFKDVRTTLAAKMHEDGTPCEFTTSKANLKVDDKCQYLQHMDISTYQDQSLKRKMSFNFIAKYKNVEASLTSGQFSGGEAEFTLNNWKGKITFSSNGASYSATNKLGETMSGEIKAD